MTGNKPITGLHFEDISKLVASFDHRIRRGHTVVVIEHNLEIVKQADWIIDLGPDGGAGGGKVVFQGHTDDMLRLYSAGKLTASHTARYLKRALNGANGGVNGKRHPANRNPRTKLAGAARKT